VELRGEELAAIGAIWKRERRTLTTSFAGVSMMPTIAPGAPLEIVCGDDAEPGEVIVFLHRGQVVVHRLLDVRRSWMLTRGDANPIPDLPVASAAIVGRVVTVSGTDAPQYHESTAQAMFRRIVITARKVGVMPARLLIHVLWRGWGATSLLRRTWKGVRW
jgi:signal peptidase I